jgi:hypothetical protein
MKAFIRVTETSSYCECCGSYESVGAHIRVGDKEDCRGYDTHLGGGNWENHGDCAELYLSVLNLIGYTVELAGVRSDSFTTEEQLKILDREEVERKGVIDILMSESTNQDEFTSYHCQKIEIDGKSVWMADKEGRCELPIALEILLRDILGCELIIETEYEYDDWPTDDDMV